MASAAPSPRVPPPPSQPDQIKWWHNSVVVALSLLFCGPFGLILVWLKPQWTTKTKGVVTGVMATLVAISVVAGAASPPPEKSPAATRPATELSPTTGTNPLSGVSAVPSPVEGFPVPATAIESKPLTTDSAADGFWVASVDYELPAGTTSANLRSWFEMTQPVGQPFGDWAWCEDASAGMSEMSVYVWSKPGAASLDGSPVDPLYDMTVLVLTIFNTSNPTTFSVAQELSSGPCFPSAPASTTPPAPAAPPPPTAAVEIMPDVIGMNLQAAQDRIQQAGRFFSDSIDCTGNNRSQINDRNWVVVAQDPAPGSPMTETPVLGVVKNGEPMSC